jgi:hypothetical protein
LKKKINDRNKSEDEAAANAVAAVREEDFPSFKIHLGACRDDEKAKEIVGDKRFDFRGEEVFGI